MKRSSIISLITICLIILWTYAAISKLIDFDQTRAQMHSQVFSATFSSILTWAIPAIELLTTALLVYSKTRIYGLYVSAILLFVFTMYIVLVINNAFGRIPCSCGGVLEKMSWGQHLAFNIVFLLLTLSSIVFELKERGPYGEGK